MIFTLFGKDHLQNFGRTKETELCKINVSRPCLVPEFFFSFKLKQYFMYSTFHVYMILLMVP